MGTATGLFKAIFSFWGGGVSHGSDPYLPLFPGEFQTHRNLSQAVPGTCLARLSLVICVI
jgi:hypothetical protein